LLVTNNLALSIIDRPHPGFQVFNEKFYHFDETVTKFTRGRLSIGLEMLFERSDDEAKNAGKY